MLKSDFFAIADYLLIFFTKRLSSEYVTNWSLNSQSHLKRVAELSVQNFIELVRKRRLQLVRRELINSIVDFLIDLDLDLDNSRPEPEAITATEV